MEKKRETILCKKFDELFENGNFQALIFYFHNAPKDQIISESWEVIPELCKNLDSSEEINAMCRNILQHIAVASPSNSIIQLLNIQLRNTTNSATFCGILEILPNLFLKLENQKPYYYNEITSTIYNYVETIPIPKHNGLEKDEVALYKLDVKYQKLSIIISSIAVLLEKFLLNFNQDEWPVCECNILLHFILNIFSNPLANIFISLKCYKSSEISQCEKPQHLSEMQIAVITFVQFINKVKPNTVKFLLEISNANFFYDKSQQNIKSSSLGQSVLAYLIFSENLLCQQFPLVYTNQFLFEFNSQYVINLLESKDFEVKNKGLALFCYLLSKLKAKSWTEDYLEWPPLKELITHVVYLAATTTLETQKEQSLRIIVTIVKAFTPSVVRCKLLSILLTKSPKQVVIGHLISLIKDEIDHRIFNEIQNLNLEQAKILDYKNENKYSIEEKEWFVKLLNLIFSLPSGEQTDILDHVDRIVGAFNLLKYLLYADHANNDYSGIWTLLPHIENMYIPILGRAMELTKAHYDLELKKLKDIVIRTKHEIKNEIKDELKSEEINKCLTKENALINSKLDKNQPNLKINDTIDVPINKITDKSNKSSRINILSKTEQQIYMMEKSYDVLNQIVLMLAEAVQDIKHHKH